jgi:hydroxyacylglutathione hydrolase
VIIEQILSGELDNFTYIIADEKTKLAAVIDPVDVNKILEIAERKKLKIKYIINTHSHFDHIAGNEELKAKTGAKVVAHENSRIKKDIAVKDGDVIILGKLKIKVIHTPGHTQDSICLLVDKNLFTGDTLFIGGIYGRTDLPGGNFEQLMNSLRKLMKLDENITIYPGHHYGEKRSSTIGKEKVNLIAKLKTKL